jgi:hypothetical protein
VGRRGYPPEFRRKALDLVASGRKVYEVAVDLSIALPDALNRAALLLWLSVGSIRQSGGFEVVPRWWPTDGVRGCTQGFTDDVIRS